MLRVQRGAWKGRRLRSPPGRHIRPMGARLRCKVIDALRQILPGTEVHDICCGTGAQGIEALSVGAAGGVFVDRHPRALRLARENVAICDPEALARCQFRHATADLHLEDLALAGGGDHPLVLFVSPPYRSCEHIAEAACRAFVPMLRPGGPPRYLVLQHPPGLIFEVEGLEPHRYRAAGAEATIFRHEPPAPHDVR